jgi:organic radical activating enzyme
LASKRIEKLQIEPTLACTLRCPGCTAIDQLKMRPKPHTMPLQLYRRLLESLAAEGYQIGFIEYCGQGEPLAHPQFAEFVRLGREILPKTKQRLVTNGNYDYAAKLEGRVLDEIYVSADGAFQENYEQYRVRGNLSRALAFLADAAAERGPVRPLSVWKYILFNFNDSPEELRAAQDFAIRFGVDMLMFVLTKTRWKSTRWTPESYPEILLHAPNARLSLVPDFLRDSAHDKPVAGAKLRRTFGDNWSVIAEHLDVLWAYPGMISVKGWARAQDPGDHVKEVQLTGDGVPLGAAQLGINRPEVDCHFGDNPPRRSGFALSALWPIDKKRPRVFGLSIHTGKGETSQSYWETTQDVFQAV